ncbi:hypothetical protein OV203_34575 [Nannocystis sp. ILAH1]|uniref:hypothetical protein n=1 Tax=unclassified Nannocystis TaxID=2627009 RepID=UPI002270FEA1|nr:MULTISPECIES: hypothetical protein [unclassified Nannocystis]MCY0992315.1 hypothetical protein [Nannocystis sp. ILAH1]MCY1069097.1 hypothetical protein [Nannocystis sp. RBIL2]
MLPEHAEEIKESPRWRTWRDATIATLGCPVMWASIAGVRRSLRRMGDARHRPGAMKDEEGVPA